MFLTLIIQRDFVKLSSGMFSSFVFVDQSLSKFIRTDSVSQSLTETWNNYNSLKQFYNATAFTRQLKYLPMVRMGM